MCHLKWPYGVGVVVGGKKSKTTDSIDRMRVGVGGKKKKKQIAMHTENVEALWAGGRHDEINNFPPEEKKMQTIASLTYDSIKAPIRSPPFSFV